LCDETCIFKSSCNFDFNGPTYNSWWAIDITFDTPRTINKWKIQSSFPNWGLESAHLELPIGNVLADSAITTTADSSCVGESSIFSSSIVVSSVRVKITSARTSSYSGSKFQLYVKNVDFFEIPACTDITTSTGEKNVTFHQINSGTCSGNGFESIETLIQCNAAAVALGLSDTEANEVTGVTYTRSLASEPCNWDKYWKRLDFNGDATS
jgi:hypothetical protein